MLFTGLFIVNAALAESGSLAMLMESLAGAGLVVQDPATLFGVTVVLSNLVSNVPAVMLLLPTATRDVPRERMCRWNRPWPWIQGAANW